MKWVVSLASKISERQQGQVEKKVPETKTKRMPVIRASIFHMPVSRAAARVHEPIPSPQPPIQLRYALLPWWVLEGGIDGCKKV